MLDKLLAAGAAMDWFTPALAFAQDWINGPSVGFAVEIRSGFSAAAIRDILAQRGVKVWGMMLVDESILFNTRAGQARFAAYLLQRNGIPFASSSRDCVDLAFDKSHSVRYEAPARNLTRRQMATAGIHVPIMERAAAELARLLDRWV